MAHRQIRQRLFFSNELIFVRRKTGNHLHNAMLPMFAMLIVGEIGDWKNQFTVADNELFESFLDKWPIGKEIYFRY